MSNNHTAQQQGKTNEGSGIEQIANDVAASSNFNVARAFQLCVLCVQIFTYTPQVSVRYKNRGNNRRTVLSREAVKNPALFGAQQQSQMILACSLAFAEAWYVSTAQRISTNSKNRTNERTVDPFVQLPRPIPRHTQEPAIIRTELDTRDRERMAFENCSDRFPCFRFVQSHDGVFG